MSKLELTTDEMRGDLVFRFYRTAFKSWLHATYKPSSQDYEHSIVVVLPEEVSQTIDQRICEALLAVQSYDYEHPADAEAPAIIRSNPRKPAPKEPQAGDSVIVTPKTPRQLEQEDEDAANKKLAES